MNSIFPIKALLPMRNIILITVLSLFAGAAIAQKSAIKLGRKYMENLAYMDAIEHYEQYLGNEKNTDAEAIFNLAEAYRKVNAPLEAEGWYERAVQLPEAQPEHKLYYGMMLQRNGKCELAYEWFKQYVDARPDDLRGQHLLRACDFEEELMTRSADIYSLAHCDFNSDMDDFSPTFYKGGLVFTSDRDRNPIIVRENAWTGNPFLELYYIDVRDRSKGDTACGNYVFGRPEKLNNEVNTKFNDASVSFGKDGKDIYFTRNNYLDGDKGTDDNGIVKLKIYYGKDLGEGKMGEFKELPFNSDEYNVAHPALTPDGNRLYFASDMPGGFGGLDLYYSDKEGSNWGPAMNMGPEVNTEGREYFPTVGPDGRIYFASDGLVGLGGLDIFYVEERTEGIFTTPENMGFPINTISDDFGITFNEAGTCGFISSDRAGGVGRDDIYSFKKIASPIEVLVIDETTRLPIEGASVQLSCKGETLTTDIDGMVRFDMKMNLCCDLTAMFPDYEPNEGQACTKNITLGDKVIVEIPLKREAKYELAGTVFDDADGLPLEGALVTLEKGGIAIDSFYTEPNGNFAFTLEEGVCYNKLKAVKGGYLSDKKEDVCTIDLTESTTIRENLHLQPIELSVNFDDQPQGAFKNDPGRNPKDPRRPAQNEAGEDIPEYNINETDYVYYNLAEGGVWTDKETGLPADGEYPDGSSYDKGISLDGKFPTSPLNTPDDVVNGTLTVGYLLHIYYDFNESYVREDAEPELMKLVEVMNEDPDYIVEIGSHTDSRGSNRFNMSLSQRRAEAVVDWLVDKGISRERLVPRGYGEKKNVNKCANYIPCGEADHQMNRRTEFKIVGCLSCVDPAEKVISKPAEKSKIRVDECLNCPF